MSGTLCVPPHPFPCSPVLNTTWTKERQCCTWQLEQYEGPETASSASGESGNERPGSYLRSCERKLSSLSPLQPL